MQWITKWKEQYKKRRTRRLLIKAFGNVLPSEAIDGIVHGNTPAPFPSEGTYQILLFQVRDDDLEAIPDYLARAMKAVRTSNASVDEIMHSFGYAVFGSYDDGFVNTDTGQAAAAADRLVEELGLNVKAVYGAVNGGYSYTKAPFAFLRGLFPHLDVVFLDLIRLDYGATAAFSPARAASP